MTAYTIFKEYTWLVNTIHHAGIRTPGLESCDSSASQSVRHLVSMIQSELEQMLGSKVDLVRVRDNMNSLLRQRILRDGIYV